MSAASDLDSLVAAARAEITDPERVKVVRGDEGKTPRFELFHAAVSICSNKVRSVLAEKCAPYLSQELVTPSNAGIGGSGGVAGNYRPGYVRLRIYGGGDARMARLAGGHTLRTSTEAEGFDACVVPTLVDHEAGRVVVDSYEICAYLDRVVPDPRLVPDDPQEAAEVMEQVRIVDKTPHPGLLYAFHPNDPRPDFLKKAMDGIYDRKIAMLNRMIDENADDSQLVAAYKAKIAREEGGKKLQYDHAFLGQIMKEFEGIIAGLDSQLASHGGPWVCGENFTLADCVWGTSLFRIHWGGHAFLWDDRPRLRDYAFRCYARPSLQEGTLNWPSPAPPSPHTADIPYLQVA
jgi:glutathione S-transferase